MPEPVIKTIDVACAPATAFRIFTQDLSRWWPKDKHSVSAMGGQPARSVTMDARQGGKLIEIGHDGTEHHWGSVKTYDPPAKLSLLWHIGKSAAEATIVEVEFTGQANGTRVTLSHHGWEILGDDAQKMRDGYNAGWVFVFETCFNDACLQEAA